MPQPDTKLDAMGGRTMPGVSVGCHAHLGGIWSGDYLVADYAPFKKDCDVGRAKVKVHRTKEVARNKALMKKTSECPTNRPNSWR